MSNVEPEIIEIVHKHYEPPHHENCLPSRKLSPITAITASHHCLPSRKLSKLDEPDRQDTAGEVRTSSYVMYSYGPPHMAVQKLDDQHEHTFTSYVRIRDVVLKTYIRR